MYNYLFRCFGICDNRGFITQDKNIYTFSKYDVNGYDYDFYNKFGFNNKGIHKDTLTKFNKYGEDLAYILYKQKYII